ncbi:hypothetical protein EON65_10200 [archaeon]|nr:MAG: hypothetical protein EON65_10200 [archaeon]
MSGILLPTGERGDIAIGDTFLFSPLVHHSVAATYSPSLFSSQHISLHVRDSFCVTQSVPHFRSFLGNAVEECYSRCIHHCLRSPALLGEVLGVGKHMEISGMHTAGVTILTNHPLYSVFKTNISLFSAGFVFDKVHHIVTLPSVVRFSKDVDRVWIVDVQDAITQAKSTFYPHHSTDLFSYSQSGILLIVGLKEGSPVYELLAHALKPSTGYLALHVSYDDVNSNVFREVLERWKPAFRMNDIVEYRGNDVVLPHKIMSSVLDLMDEWGGSDAVDKEDFSESSLIRYASLAGQTNHNPVPGAGRLAAQCSHLLAEAQRLSTFDFQHLPAFQPKIQNVKSKTLVVAGHVGCGIHSVTKSMAQQLQASSDNPQLSLQVITLDFSAFDAFAQEGNNDIDWTGYVGSKLSGIDQSSTIVMIVLLLTGRIQLHFSALLATLAAVSKRRIHQVVSVLSPSASFSAYPSRDNSLGSEYWRCQTLELLQPHCSDVVVAIDNAAADQQHTGYDLMRAYLTSAHSTAYLIKLSPQAMTLSSEDITFILQKLQSTSAGMSDREASSMMLGYPLQCQVIDSSTEHSSDLYPVYNKLSVPTLTQYRVDNASNTWMVDILLKLMSTVFFTLSKLPAYKVVDTWHMKPGRRQGGFHKLVDIAAGKLFSKQHTQIMEQRLLKGIESLGREYADSMKALSSSVLAVYGEVHMHTQRIGNDAYHHHSIGRRDNHVACIEGNEAWISLQASIQYSKQSSDKHHSYVLIQGMFTPSMLKMLDSLFSLCERISLPKRPILAASDVDDKRKVIQNRHEFEERGLPFGWFFDGTFFLDSSGNKSELRPDIADLVAEYVQAENAKIRRYNELLSSYEL